MLTNAVKYTPEGGTILLKTAVLADGVHVEVTDNGIGMDAEPVARAFDLFGKPNVPPIGLLAGWD